MGAATHVVYILECADGSFYVGSTANLEFRLRAHRSGRASTFTSRRLPVTLVFQELHSEPKDALAREKQIKRWSRAKKAALITGDLIALHSHARRRKGR